MGFVRSVQGECFLPKDTLCFGSLATRADVTLFASIIRYQNHGLRSLCTNHPTVTYNLRPRDTSTPFCPPLLTEFLFVTCFIRCIRIVIGRPLLVERSVALRFPVAFMFIYVFCFRVYVFFCEQ